MVHILYRTIQTWCKSCSLHSNDWRQSIFVGWGSTKLTWSTQQWWERRLTSQVQIFDITSGKWDTKPTKGNPPLGVYAYSCITLNNKIYYFGGWCAHGKCFHNSLNKLDASTLTWTQISPTDDRRLVMKRSYGDIMLSEYGGVHHLLVIGGLGSLPSTKLPQAQYIQSLSVVIYILMNRTYIMYPLVSTLIYHIILLDIMSLS